MPSEELEKTPRQRGSKASAEQTRSLLENIRTQLHASVPREGTSDDLEELDRQLRSYFDTMTPAAASGAAAVAARDIRERVINGVVERILQTWEQGGAGSLEREVTDRLIDTILRRVTQQPKS